MTQHQQNAISKLFDKFEQELTFDEGMLKSYAAVAHSVCPRHSGYWTVSLSRHARWLLNQRNRKHGALLTW